MQKQAGGEEGVGKPLLTPGLYNNVICVWWLGVWKALCPIRSVQHISTWPWQRWSGSFRRHCGTEPAKRAQTPQVEQAEINEHHKPHLFSTRWHRMNIPSAKLFHIIFQLLKLTYNIKKGWIKIFNIRQRNGSKLKKQNLKATGIIVWYEKLKFLISSWCSV